MKISSSRSIIESLISENIEFIFGYPGGAVLHIYDEIFKSGIKHILVRHEQAAIHIADGYSRSSKKIGVVLVTSGPGYTNCITGLATSNFDNSSILVLCGQVIKKLISQNSFQELDNLNISTTIVKNFFSLNCYYNIQYLISKSFKISKFKKGPVVIDFPKNLTDNNYKLRNKYPFLKNKKKNNKNFNINFHFKRPIILIGGGIKNSFNFLLLDNFIKKSKIPFISSFMGLGGFNYRNLYYLGWLGMHGDSCVNNIIHFSDFIICIGTRLDDRITNENKLFTPYAKIIHIDINIDSISKTIFCKNFFLIDLIYFLNKKIKKKNFLNWWKFIIFLKKFFKKKYKNDFYFCKPQQIIEFIFLLSKGKMFITTDVGQHQMFAAKYYNFNYKCFITSGGLGTMGFGLPSAIGVKFANKNKKILLITGEGSFQMMMQELSTCKQYKINILIVNLNNQSLGMVKQWQELNYKNRYSHSYINSLPNFKKLLNSYNFYSFSFYKIRNFFKLFKKIIFKNIFCFVNIYINQKENVFPIQIFNKSMCEFITFFSIKKYEKKFNFNYL
ncbi:thiamine pyrophosphate-dependent enzyme [Candidatus Carsonella ruddii]|uniref:Thiamine pyrophosphate-dependent enzyme n=2 Tax=cellular organisms TaxID=131567 RepID=A0AAJ6FDE8_CARRU|nr:thiamine pyrophosphate-dependent enzyme [Candidatus Carsonella ruddii]WGS66618.1 thiamine pyrophosphate-dependent enzyme [Candidatus Carsonella ruddii]WGS66815.1 thiamine pyrophosphate-dependent enzyme [Candidatus Carsonella ruddii]WGS67007.1 thiamine pyrophosphate-dependent enzyme [Candidatus Carsonella ruddii]WGS67198.1 thiamine pyrophosphate-dependent enzyme [Candidatus Carsonella ruddii]WMC18215.1 MAG: thiamine pyrophosphate-binding protein [Candidatus Carsonella ruddii]